MTKQEVKKKTGGAAMWRTIRPHSAYYCLRAQLATVPAAKWHKAQFFSRQCLRWLGKKEDRKNSALPAELPGHSYLRENPKRKIEKNKGCWHRQRFLKNKTSALYAAVSRYQANRRTGWKAAPPWSTANLFPRHQSIQRRGFVPSALALLGIKGNVHRI